MKKFSDDKGYAVFVAVILTTILLGIGLAISSLTLREFRLSTSLKDSQVAFFVADTGIECALRWDFASGVNVFPTSTDTALLSVPGIYDCIGKDIDNPAVTNWTVDPSISDTAATTTFLLKLGSNDEECVEVRVAKYSEAAGDPSNTNIEARGRNICTNNGSLRRVERAIRATY